MTDTPSIENELVSFFVQISQKDKALLNAVKQRSYLHLSQDHWQFTLPGLHDFLQQYSDTFSKLDYLQFRQLIYNSQINQAIRPYGAEITIHDNQDKVDKSTYALIWHDT